MLEKCYLVKLGDGFISEYHNFTLDFKDIMYGFCEYLSDKEDAIKLAKEVGGTVLKFSLQEVETTKSIGEPIC
ncbi:hypothetical protein P3U41_06200 [Mammaliicoccus sciuri]|uniref:hypothetical protein n=1 Tax=Mammaliicoccus sciuri TaxID=1296 RepID=UPI002B25D767|nr:hypothetical protein [Mammaliicoccus sciuri]WQL34363.1 hypothetical protein P3U41_06200 [Mammaliicoccus sciuri]WQL61302.1 hypothetical protein P3T96_06200 [Mammaliicoccus sciuri]